MTAPATHRLLPPLEDEELELLEEEDEELDEEELELLDEEEELELLDDEELLEDEEDEEDDELLLTGPTEHQAEEVKLLVGKADGVQAKLPVLVA